MWNVYKRLRITAAKVGLLERRAHVRKNELEIANAKITIYKAFTKTQGEKLRRADNKYALAMGRIGELTDELEGLRADMADVLDKVAAINETHRLIPRAVAPKFQVRARMFSLDTKDGLDV